MHSHGNERAFCIDRDFCSKGYELISQWNNQLHRDEVVCLKVDLDQQPIERTEDKPEDQGCYDAFGQPEDGYEWHESWKTGEGICKLMGPCPLGHRHWSPSMDEVVCPFAEELRCANGALPRNHWDEKAKTHKTFCQDEEQPQIDMISRNLIFTYHEHYDQTCGDKYEGTGQCERHRHYCNGNCDWEQCDWENQADWNRWSHSEHKEVSYCVDRHACSEGYHMISQWSPVTREEGLICVKIRERDVAQEHDRASEVACDQSFGAAPEGYEWGEDWSSGHGRCKLMSTCINGHQHWSPTLSASVCPLSDQLFCPDGSIPREFWNPETERSTYYCQQKEDTTVTMTERFVQFRSHHHHVDDHHSDKPAWVQPDYTTVACEDDPEGILSEMNYNCKDALAQFGGCDSFHSDVNGYERFAWAMCPQSCGACPRSNVATVHYSAFVDPVCQDEVDNDVETFVFNECYIEHDHSMMLVCEHPGQVKMELFGSKDCSGEPNEMATKRISYGACSHMQEPGKEFWLHATWNGACMPDRTTEEPWVVFDESMDDLMVETDLSASKHGGDMMASVQSATEEMTWTKLLRNHETELILAASATVSLVALVSFVSCWCAKRRYLQYSQVLLDYQDDEI